MDTRHRFFILMLPLFAAAQFFAQTAAHAGQVLSLGTAAAGTQGTTMVAVSDEGVQAQGLVDRLGKEALSAITDKSMNDSARKQTFRRLLTQNFDMGTIGRFAMGRYWRVATPAQQQEYSRLYEKMIIDVYTARFNKYSGQSFSVTGNRMDASGDIVVNSTVSSPGSAPVAVDWRVRPKGGAYRIIDVMVEGVSMAVTQRNDFAGVIQQGGGDVEALLAYLRNGGTSDVKK